MEETTINNLPPELLVKVLQYLPRSDRLNCALTCQLWAEALSTSPLLDDVCFKIRGEFEAEEAKAVLMRSDRQYRDLEVSKSDLSVYDAEFWTKIGRNLRELSLNKCWYSSYVFHTVLRKCSKLETLRIIHRVGCRAGESPMSMVNFEIPEDTCLEEIQESTRFVRRLYLDFVFNDDILAHLLKLMPNVTSISIAWYADVPNLISRLGSVLGTSRVITDLYFCDPFDDGRCLIELIRLSSASLRTLWALTSFSTPETCVASSNCTKLRSFSFCGGDEFNDDYLKTLLSNNPDLESLSMGGCKSLTGEGYAAILGLQKLKGLTFSRCIMSRPEEFLCRLENISTLWHLSLGDIEIDVPVLLGLRNLQNLEWLDLTCRDWTSECLEVFFENFKHLKELGLSECDALTDAYLARFQDFEELRRLSFSDNHPSTDRSFENGFGSSALEHLEVSCSLTDAGLASILDHHSRLRYLDIRDCVKISVDGMGMLLQRSHRLRTLVLKEGDAKERFLDAYETLRTSFSECCKLDVFLDEHVNQSTVEILFKWTT